MELLNFWLVEVCSLHFLIIKMSSFLERDDETHEDMYSKIRPVSVDFLNKLTWNSWNQNFLDIILLFVCVVSLTDYNEL